MVIADIASFVTIANGVCTVLGYLSNVTNKAQQNNKKCKPRIKTNKDEKKRCKAILKKHNLPKSVGIMCKSQNDICFMPDKAIVNKNLNNLNLKSSGGSANLFIGGGYFALCIQKTNAAQNIIMNGTVIEYKGEIYLLRHQDGGNPNYLAKLELFMNGMIVELDDGFKVGLFY